MTTPRTRDGRWRRHVDGDDAGFVLPAVLGVVVLAMTLVGAVTTVALHTTASTRAERTAASARASAEAGVAEALAEVARAGVRLPDEDALPAGVYQCSYHVNEHNHPETPARPRSSLLTFYDVDLRYGAGLPPNAPPPSHCPPREDHHSARPPADGTITLVSEGRAVHGQRGLLGLTGYDSHVIDVELTNTGTTSAPVWSITSWRDRPSS